MNTMPALIERSQRIEELEGRANAAFVETRRRLQPGGEAQWLEMDGTLVMFDGPDSPLTQTFCLGIRAAARTDTLEAIERFYTDLGAPAFHEVSPYAPADLLELLSERGYRVVEQTSILTRNLVHGTLPVAPDTGMDVRRTTPHNADADIHAWIEASVAGWAEYAEYADVIRGFASVNAARTDNFNCGVWDGDVPVGTASMFVYDGVALLNGASTVPAYRSKGVQRALLAYRLEQAHAMGCTMAVMGARPGSTSESNAVRSGFTVAYTRSKWFLPLTAIPGT